LGLSKVKLKLNCLDKAARAALVKHMLNESHLDHAFQALSDPARRNMLSRLSRGPASVSELAAPLRMSLPAVLQHLKALEESGLVSTEKKGRVRTARLEGDAIAGAEQWLTDRRTEWEAQADRLESFLATLQDKGE
jgi:DNA-binding transcriptional ArsR family regulator